jgi:hypothetical protein
VAEALLTWRSRAGQRLDHSCGSDASVGECERVSDFHLELGFHSLFLGSLAIRATKIG